jgi:valyl-tRNA synthetase
MDKTQLKTEEEIYKTWEKAGYFKADPISSKTPYSLLMPPPNLTGEPHMGHAMQHSVLDAIARYKRMQGFDVLLLPGVDHAGIQFESTLNKRLSKEGFHKGNLTREQWLEKAWAFKEEMYSSFHGTWTIFGISADWSREVFTLEPKVQKAVLAEFKTFWDQDLLYKGAYIVQWCPKDATAIEDVEMEYQERKEKFYYINYTFADNPTQFITIATVRPETMFADVAVAVNPKDKRYKNFIGKKVIVPFVGREVPIIADELIDMKLGSGALKVDPAHSLVDYEIGKKNNLEIIAVIGKDGKLNENAGQFTGQHAQEVRSVILQELEKQNLLAKTEDITHSVPVCERCKTTVEPLISEEWFVKMKPLATKALKEIDKIRFVPTNYKKITTDWLENIHDWSISRSLWWGHRIPVWYCQKCNPNHFVGKDKDMFIALEPGDKSCQTCGLKNWIQDEQVLDTWFSSGLWPMATLGWPDETPELKKYYPYNFELSAPEIKYLWIARMIMLGLWFKDNIPFENMFYHGTLRDLQGRKMSKSLGNGVDPVELINTWGTDATRMTLYSYSAPGRDPKASKQTMDERAKNYRNFATKLKNLSKFIIDLKPEDAKAESDFSHPEDIEIIQYLNGTIEKVTANLDNYQLHLAIDELYDFLWHKFADSYIESSKKRRAEAQPTLEYVFKTSLELLHPFMPFVTEELWQKLPHQEKSIMIASWPKIKPEIKS